MIWLKQWFPGSQSNSIFFLDSLQPDINADLFSQLFPVFFLPVFLILEPGFSRKTSFPKMFYSLIRGVKTEQLIHPSVDRVGSAIQSSIYLSIKA